MIRGTDLIRCYLLIVVFAGGCSSASHDDYLPSEDVGRQAIDTALSAWQAGMPMERIESETKVAVQAQDSDWKAGKKLTGFSIEKELPSTEGPKQFAVRLTFDGEAEPVDTVFYVVGRDPIWIFRDRDYKKTTGM